MSNYNYLLQEAIEKTTPVNINPLVAEYKKALHQCCFTQFRSETTNELFFDSFFYCHNTVDLKANDMMNLYRTLLSEPKFMENLCAFICNYKVKDPSGMFQSIMNQVEDELDHMRMHRMVFLTSVKAFWMFMEEKFTAIQNLISARTQVVESFTLISIIVQVIRNFYFYTCDLVKRETNNEMNKIDKQEEISHTYQSIRLEEDVQELLYMFEHADEIIDEMAKEEMGSLTEGIVNTAIEKAKEWDLAKRKAEQRFDEKLMDMVRQLRVRRQNRKHAEMVGEALRVSHELKLILKSGALAFIPKIGPFMAITTFVVATIINRKTNNNDRKVLVGQIKDELEIIEEKIQIAEKNGDDKGKIELIRLRQKLQREYRKITKLPFEASAMDSKML